MLGRALATHFGVAPELMLETLTATSAARVLPTDFAHDGSDLRDALDYTSLPTDKSAYRGMPVLFLTRDVRDVLVSSYFETTRRAGVFERRPPQFEGSLSEFVESPVLGVRKVAAFYAIWAARRHVPASFLCISYEQLRARPRELLTTVLEFVGAGAVSPASVAEAVDFASFRNMRTLEAAGAVDDPRLRPGDPLDDESYKVRRGVVGGYVDYMSAADLAYVDRELERFGRPFGARPARDSARV
jgi:hypothetical protein